MKHSIFTTILFLCSLSAGAQIDGAVRMRGGKNITNDPDGLVVLELFGRGATEMMVSNDPSFPNQRWRPYETSIKWRLKTTDGDGLKNVYVMFKDNQGNVSDVIETVIELDRQPPTDCSITINGGAKYTNARDRLVSVELYAQEAKEMQISLRSDFVGAQWVPYAERRKMQLLGEDGEKIIYARFRDVAGNVSQPVSARIILDASPPLNPRVLINNGDAYTNKEEVTLFLSAQGAKEVFIRGGSEWLPMQNTIQWKLEPPGDGERVVQVRFRDEAGNYSAVAQDAIIVDTEPPLMPRISIDGGNRYTKSNSVVLRLSAIGAHEMQIANDSSFQNVAWRPYNVSSAWTLPERDGVRRVYVRFRDQAGNLSETAWSEIILDRVPPTKPHIEIVGDMTKISNDTSATVNLKISAEGAKYMMLSNTSNFYNARWEVYRTEVKNWKLGSPGDDGEKGVYVKFRDEAGNVSDIASTKIKLDRTKPIDCRIVIDNNREFTTHPDKKVNLTLFARGATEMMISNNSTFVGAKWQPYNTSIEWTLEGEDGLKNVVAKFRDQAGNESDIVADNIILDRKPPFDCSIVINRGDSITNDPDKVVVVKVKAKQAALMMISNSPDFAGERWRGYSELNINWALSGGDGVKTVYAKFKDEAGNESHVYSDDIILDRTPPKKGSVKILAENQQVKFQQVKLELLAQDAVEMMISNFYDFRNAKWEPYTTTKDWTLIGEDGVKMVFVKFKDRVNNISQVAYDKIGLDMTAPRGGDIKINNGARYCTNINKLVTLKLSVQDAVDMMISNNKDFKDAKWQRYEPYIYNWKLEGEDGEKQVFAKFRDRAGNETQPVVASIILDRQEPINEKVIINNNEECTNAANGKVKLDISAEGAKEMMISNNKYFNNASWEPYKESREWILSPSDGEKTVFVKFRDEAGNESGIASDNILLDTDAPIPGAIKFAGNNQTLTKTTLVTLEFNARKANFMMISNSPRFDDGAIWEPYQASKKWSLRDGAGLKRVYAKFKDNCNNECQPISREITLVYEN
ncbi:MAG: hypothetical protein RMJ87_12310 [Cytophagales bacterium]|nr:hypothetical protein [Bernardetiaceae bacterium]MDW8205805.1 hypothetical protein [Cytophagales bacterium]